MVDSIKITALQDIGANIAYTTLVPVVNMAGTPTTQKSNLQNLGNLILNGAGGSYFARAAQANLALSVANAAQPNITSVGTLTSLAVTGNITAGNVNGGNIVVANFYYGDGGFLTNVASGSNYSNSNVANYLPTFTGIVGANTIRSTANSGSNVQINANGAVFTFGQGGALYWPAPGGAQWVIEPNSDNEFEIRSTSNVVISTDINNANSHFTFASDGSVYCPANANFEGTRLNVGPGAANVPLATNPTLVVTDSGLEFIQAALINDSSNGSSDYAAYGADSDETQGFADLGFAGHTFNDPNYTITEPGDGYVFSQGYANGIGGGLVLATGENGNVPDIVFATGGFLANAEFARIDHANDVFHLTRAGSGIKYPDGSVQTSAGVGSASELVNGDNSFVIDADGNVVFEGDVAGQGVNRGLVWDYGANANGVNSQVRQDNGGLSVRAWTTGGGGANGYSAPVNIVTNQDADEKQWVFDGDGNLTLPGNLRMLAGNIVSDEITPTFNSAITGITTGNVTVIVTITDSPFEGPVQGQVTISSVTGTTEANGIWYYEAVEENQFQLYIDDTYTTPVDGTFWTPYVSGGTAASNGTYSDLTIQGGNISINNNGEIWTFGANGVLTIPNDIISNRTIDIDNRVSGNTSDINIYSADDILLQARDRATGSTSEGGDINIFAGDSAEDSDSTGGDVVIEAGNGGASNIDTGGDGGFIRLQAGRGGAASTGGGASALDGGTVTLRAGNGGDNNGNIARGAQGGDIVIDAGDSTGNGQTGGEIFISSGQAGANGLAGRVQISTPVSDSGPGGTWIFDGMGVLEFPGGGTIRNSDSLDIGGSNAISLEAGGVVNIYADTNGNAYQWQFGDDGNLILAGGNSVIQSVANSSLDPLNPNVSTMIFTPDSGYSSQSLVLDPTAPGHIHLRAPGANIDEPNANIFLGGEESSFEVGYYTGSAPNVFIHSGGNTWEFLNDGNLVFPRDDANGDPILRFTGGTNPRILSEDASLAGPANLEITALYTKFTGSSGEAITIYPDDGEISGDANIQIWANAAGNTQYSWTFGNDGTLTVPSEGTIRSNDDIIMLQSYDTPNSISRNMRLGTDGALYLEQTGLIPTSNRTWLTIDPNAGNVEITASVGVVGSTEGGDLSIAGGAAEQSTFNTSAGGNVNITGGLGASDDGGGGGPGGSVNISAGLSADPVGVSGNVVVTVGGSIYTFTELDLNVTTNPPASPAPSLNGFGLVSAPIFTNGNGNVTINANLNEWVFDSTGNLTIPGSSGGFIKTVANASIGIAAVDNGTNNPAQLLSMTNAGAATSIVSAYATNATIQTNATGTINTWAFDSTGNLTLPGNTVAINFSNGSPAFANLVRWTTAPVANTSAGTAGQAAYDSGGNLYVCVSTNTWAKFSGTTSW